MSELRNLDWDQIIEKLMAFATSEYGRQELKNTAPVKSSNDALQSFSEITEFTPLIKQGLRPHMESLDLCTPWLQRLSRNAILKPLEIKDVRHFCLETLALKEMLKDFNSPFISDLASQLMEANEPLSAIDQIMTPGGDIRMDASETLHQLNVEKTGLSRQVQNTLDRLVKAFDIEYLLQEKFVTTREGRWVLPIKSGMQHGFDGIVHASSQSKQTVFMEPQEVVPVNNRLREIEIEIEQEIERLLTQLSTYLSSLRFSFENTKNTLITCDRRIAECELSVHLNAHSCSFSEHEITLNDLRHPLLTYGNRNVVSNTVEMNKDRRILLLSGPNAGGKTVLLKAIGLAAQMARCGLPICASSGSTLPFFKNLVVSVGDSQSVDADLSTFAAHLKTLDYATTCQSSQTLLLLDEICGSTDPEEGAALAKSFIETYRDNEVFGVITSHLGALKRGWEENSGIINGSLDFDPTKGPTYRFIMGVPGQSLAIQTAERAGVRKKIIERAIELLSPEVRKYQAAVQEVDAMKQELLHMQDLLSKELKSAEKQKVKYDQLINNFNIEKENILNKEVLRAKKTIEGLIQEVKVKDVFRKHEELEKIKFELPQIIKATSDTERGSSTQSTPSTADEFIKAYPAGSTVHIGSLGRDGIIQGHPNARGEIPVLSSSMHLHIHWQDLKPSRHSQNPTQKVLRKSGHFSFSPTDQDRVVDLRGLSSEDAISQLEIQLDTASLGSEDRVKVVHGHGTDTLKRAIRSYLSRSVYVKKWQAGTNETGGDGITWIELK
ncbi:MAG: Smr/MutS family protein [Bdellovibrionales bacterium]|nr:Smr/MutS family protein [Bdellovibrionales bacterium]